MHLSGFFAFRGTRRKPELAALVPFLQALYHALIQAITTALVTRAQQSHGHVCDAHAGWHCECLGDCGV
jgi:hypothetical protein